MRQLFFTVVFLWAASAVAAGESQEVSRVSAKVTTEKQPTIITSNRLTFDYKARIAVFEGNVVVNDPQLRIETDKLTVTFDKSEAAKTITAQGSVGLREGDKLATCEKAVYEVKTGEMVMTGDPHVWRGQDVLIGDKITLWRGQDRVVCEPGYLKFFPSGDGKYKERLFPKE